MTYRVRDLFCLILILASNLFFSASSFAQNYESTTLVPVVAIGYGMGVDNYENTYVSGSFSSSQDFDPGPGSYVLNPGSGVYDGFIAKYDVNNALVWAVQLASTFECYPYDLSTDNNNNIYITGAFWGTIDLDPGPGVYSVPAVGSGRDYFLLKLDSAGTFIWGKTIGSTTSYIHGFQVEIDDSGYVYTCGSFDASADFDPGPGTVMVSTTGVEDVFVNKFDALGNFIWVKSWGSTGGDRGLGLAINDQSEVFTTGFFVGTADFNAGAGTFNLTSAGAEDVFINKLDQNGAWIWAKRFGSNQLDAANDIYVHSNGSIYSVGNFSNTVDFNPGAGTFTMTSAGNIDAFIQKLDPAGNFVWVKKIGSTQQDWYQSIEGDIHSNLYLAGTFSLTCDLDPNAGIYNVTSMGSQDFLIEKLDSNGNFLWGGGMGGTYQDGPNEVDVDAAMNSYFYGDVTGTFDANIFAGADTVTSGMGHGIVIKINECINTTSTINASACGSYSSPSGNTYLSSGTFMDTISNIAGCDSVITINLTIYPNLQSNPNISACDNYFWQGNLYTNSGNYTDTLTTLHGCDSIVTLDLVINNSISTDTTVVACDSYLWQSILYTSSGIYMDTLTTQLGCDSIVELDLTIDTVNVMITSSSDTLTALQLGSTYQWLDCNNSFAPVLGETNQQFISGVNGSFAVSIMHNGCLDTSGCITVSGLGFENFIGNNRIDIYPNPVRDQLNIDPHDFSISSIRIFNTWGEVVFFNYYNENYYINTTFFSPGLYFVEFSDKINIVCKKFIKVN